MLIGHQKQWQFLIKSAELEKLSHLYLFWGEEKLGKKTFAFEFIKWLFKEQKISPEKHPDLIFIEPEDVGKEIKINQIRNLIWRLSLKTSLADYKVGIVDDAHLMNFQAQNCFLKTLEEPKGKALLILITAYPEKLLPTILSRVQKIRFFPLKRKEIEDYLAAQKLKEREEILIFSSGKPGLMMEFLFQPEKLKKTKKFILEIMKIINSDLNFRFQYAKKISQEFSNPEEILNIWQRYFRQILLKSAMENKFSTLTYLKLKNMLEAIQNTRSLISDTNVNLKLALENLMLKF
ncbi:MAG: hypothetical protein KY055_01565 [Candidatus Nealsonbacteria bacterium]|nr:hypothetical protein [Candidatus Nealsonbacteria bacterium]